MNIKINNESPEQKGTAEVWLGETEKAIIEQDFY